MSSVNRHKIVTRVEKLIKDKALTEDQLLHLLYIFSREDKVKITANQTRRLFRLEKYSDDTIKNVLQFLDVAETQRIVGPENPVQVIKPSIHQNPPIEEMSKRAREVKKKLLITQPLIEVKETLPLILPPVGDEIQANDIGVAANVENKSVLSSWLVEQTKRGKQAKKIDPQLCCPTMLSVLSTNNRQLPPKKRKKTSKKKLAARVESEESEAECEIEPDSANDYLLIQEGEIEQNTLTDLVDEDPDVGAAEAEGEGEDGDEEEDVVEGDDEENEEDVEGDEAEPSAHSVIESDSDDDDD